MSNRPKIGDVRIVKADSRNYCVQQYKEIESTIKGTKEKHKEEPNES